MLSVGIHSEKGLNYEHKRNRLFFPNDQYPHRLNHFPYDKKKKFLKQHNKNVIINHWEASGGSALSISIQASQCRSSWAFLFLDPSWVLLLMTEVLSSFSHNSAFILFLKIYFSRSGQGLITHTESLLHWKESSSVCHPESPRSLHWLVKEAS